MVEQTPVERTGLLYVENVFGSEILKLVSNIGCCNWQGLSPVLMPLTGLAPASPYFGLRAMGQLSFPQ